ncbi:hypothetical protein [Pseudoduganella violaceinigra]|uniref:hypothetical protein n=1 Tax=Pseudoduganella violaceinigra TaxID=246602 RepID=UPI000423BF13|nr:hypothetical protein [Pseudoduganella violaceinigra]
MQRLLSSTVVAVSLLLSGSVLAAEVHAPVGAPDVAVGDSWTYQYIDVWKKQPGNLNRMEVTAVDDSGIQVDIKRAASGALVSQQRFSRDMNPVDRGKMHFAPAFVRYAFPLEPGKEWSSEATGDNPTVGKRWRYQVKGKAVGWEKIKVQAGEFDAMKIVVTAYYQGREVGTTSGSGKLTETLWYVPAVNNFVKLEYQDTDWMGRTFNRDEWELAAYTNKMGATN